MLNQTELEKLKELIVEAELCGQLQFFIGKIRLETATEPLHAITQREYPYIEIVKDTLDLTQIYSIKLHMQDFDDEN